MNWNKFHLCCACQMYKKSTPGKLQLFRCILSDVYIIFIHIFIIVYIHITSYIYQQLTFYVKHSSTINN